VNAVLSAAQAYCGEIETLSARLGERVALDAAAVLDRGDTIALEPPGLWSPNRSCRLVRAADGWIAVNLPRPSDLELIPAWTGAALEADPWEAVEAAAARTPWAQLVEGARVLGLAVAAVGEVAADRPAVPGLRVTSGRSWRAGLPTVIDLSSLWAGPLCGSVLAQAGWTVTKLESAGRPDASRATPAFFTRLNGAKAEASLDFGNPRERARLADRIASADVVITGARPRAFEQLGITPEAMFARNPGLTWVAVTGHGWRGDGADRVAFGDDAAAAGGLVRWEDGEPRFIGDALADPLTGLAAAVAAMTAVEQGGGVLVDAAMARVAAEVAAGA